ncbi:ABC transporter ATP-binding protein [Shinella oryzae]|uniref:ABC transporter ATP-binding protein n=1 Tax=Shinella oryzae TaxID=2871820 RepID=UPI001FF5847A|nr:ABC transporter ATP-binding protein [Shinella oryzae]UPA26779.1 ABC transporter ATP-binding protein [Shinella oryzae]
MAGTSSLAFRPHRKAENALCGHLTRKNFPAALLSLIDGDKVGMKPASKRDIAFVFQMFALYPHMNVRKNISYPLISQGMTREEVSKRMAEVARIRRIEHIIDKPVGGLSGGDRQRVALGRAIVRQPKAFFMDEPLGELDVEFREHMAEELRALHDRMGATTVYVTHDQLGAMQMGDKIVVMHHGVVEQFGKPQQIYDWPATKFVVQFIGSSSMNFLDFEGMIGIGGDGVDLAGVRLAVPSVREGRAGRLTLGVRPEHVKFRDDAAYRGRVTAVEYLGTTQILTLSTGHGDLKARISSGYKVREEELVGLDFDARTLTLFDADNGKALVSEANEGVLGNG